MRRFFPGDQVLNFRRLIDTGSNSARAPLGPRQAGLGLGFDPAALDRYAVDDRA
jgi:hypothetical protein